MNADDNERASTPAGSSEDASHRAGQTAATPGASGAASSAGDGGPSEKTRLKMYKFAENYANKSGSYLHPDESVTEAVVLGLAKHKEGLGKPLCPCRFYPDKEQEVKYRTWICACDDMQIYKYCHCLLFTDEQGLPITEHLPDDHEGRASYGEVKDPHPDQGRPLRHKADEREKERRERPS